MQELLDELDPQVHRQYATPPDERKPQASRE
jgi:hypothetical protein